jgi:hypothetical protein
MSSLMIYHDRGRSVVATDGRTVRFENGEAIATDENVPKCHALGNRFLFGACGPEDVCTNLRNTLGRFVDDYPSTQIPELANVLAHFARLAWDDRKPVECDSKFHVLEAVIIGFDDRESRVRCFAVGTKIDFKIQETTADDNARIAAAGYYTAEDASLLHSLTAQMGKAGMKGTLWIGSQLRDTINELNARHPVNVGKATFFAWLDKKGVQKFHA